MSSKNVIRCAMLCLEKSVKLNSGVTGGNMAFLGLNIDNSKKYTQTIHVPLRLTGCSLRTFTEGRTTLKVSIDDQTFILGHLQPNSNEQITLESIFEVGETVTFECDGPNDVSLVGELLVDDEGMDDEDFNEYGMAESDISESIEEDVEPKIEELKEELVQVEKESEDVKMTEVSEEEFASDAELEEEMNEEEVEAILAEVKKWKQSEEITEEDIAEYIQTLVEEGVSEEEMTEEQEMEQLVAAVKESTGKKTVTDKDIEEFLAAFSGSEISESESEETTETAEVVEEFQKPGQKRKQPEPAVQKKQKKEEVVVEKQAKEEKLNKNERVTKEGIVIKEMNTQNGYKCKNGDKVSVRYLGRLPNGKTFDSNMKGSPFEFTLGKGDVIKGWDLGVVGMTEGSTRKLTIPANLAYGKRGSPPQIPGNSKLVFDVKLLKIKGQKNKK